MKTRILLGAMFGLTLCLATAQDGERQRDQERRGDGRRAPERMDRQREGGMRQAEGPGFVMPLIATLDGNKDGTIDAEEMERAKESLKKLDRNDDRKLTPDEYRFQRPPGMAGPMAGGGFGGGQRPDISAGRPGRGGGPVTGEPRMRGPGPDGPEGFRGAPGRPGDRGVGPAGVGNFPGMQNAPGFHLMPPPMQERLQLNDKQKKKLAELEEATKKKVDNILTKEQKEQMKRMGR